MSDQPGEAVPAPPGDGGDGAPSPRVEAETHVEKKEDQPPAESTAPVPAEPSQKPAEDAPTPAAADNETDESLDAVAPATGSPRQAPLAAEPAEASAPPAASSSPRAPTDDSASQPAQDSSPVEGEGGHNDEPSDDHSSPASTEPAPGVAAVEAATADNTPAETAAEIIIPKVDAPATATPAGKDEEAADCTSPGKSPVLTRPRRGAEVEGVGEAATEAVAAVEALLSPRGEKPAAPAAAPAPAATTTAPPAAPGTSSSPRLAAPAVAPAPEPAIGAEGRVAAQGGAPGVAVSALETAAPAKVDKTFNPAPGPLPMFDLPPFLAPPAATAAAVEPEPAAPALPPPPIAKPKEKGEAVNSLLNLFVPPSPAQPVSPRGAAPSPAPTPTASTTVPSHAPPPSRPPPVLAKKPDTPAPAPPLLTKGQSGGALVDGKGEKQPSPKVRPPTVAAALKPKDSRAKCKICEQEPLTHMFLPCGHKAACETCGTDWVRTLGTCRVCLSPATGVAPIPGSSSSLPAAPPPLTAAGGSQGSLATPAAAKSAPPSPAVPAVAAAKGASSVPSSPVPVPRAAPAAAPPTAPTPGAAPAAGPAVGSSPVGPTSIASAVQKKLQALPKYASLRQRGLATFLVNTGQEGQLDQVNTIDLTAPKGDEGQVEHKEVDLSQNFENFQEDHYNTGVKLFNEKPKKGIEHLINHRVITKDPNAVAQFLLSAEELDKVKIGDYVGEPDPFNVEVLKAFAGRLDFKNLDFDIALRQMLTRFRLPGEAQKIDRIMNSFAVRYYLQNKNHGVFKSSDAVYVLAFAVIMLNTDLHNPQVKKKMSKEEFLKNNRGINEGENLPNDFLEDLYERIKNDEIKMKTDGGKWAKASKKGWLQFAKNKDSPKKLWFILSESMLFFFKKMGDPELGNVPLQYFKLEKDKSKKLTFTLSQAEKFAKNPIKYTLQAPNEREFASWINLLASPTQSLEVLDS